MIVCSSSLHVLRSRTVAQHITVRLPAAMKRLSYTLGMAVFVEMHHTGSVPAERAEIKAVIEHVLADRPGEAGFDHRIARE